MIHVYVVFNVATRVQVNPGMCTPDSVCRAASQPINIYKFSQCNVDADCTLSGTADQTRPPSMLCCDEVVPKTHCEFRYPENSRN